MKTCTKCGVEQEDECFSVIRRHEDGSVKYRNSWCSTCKKARHHEKHNITPRKVKAVTETHKECTKCHVLHLHEDFRVTKRNEDGSVKYRASWCSKCADEAEISRRGGRTKPIPVVLESSKECLHCHQILDIDDFSPSQRGRLGCSAYCRVCTNIRNKLDENYKEKHREYVKSYRARNLYKWRAAHRIHQFNRRSSIKATDDGTVTSDFLDLLYTKESCCWCGEFTEMADRTIEHVTELSAGGAHSASNLDMACKTCNFSRKGKNNGRSKRGSRNCCKGDCGQCECAGQSVDNLGGGISEADSRGIDESSDVLA